MADPAMVGKTGAQAARSAEASASVAGAGHDDASAGDAARAQSSAANEDVDARRQLDEITAAFAAGVSGYMHANPSGVASFYKGLSFAGTLSNLNESLKAAFGYGKALGEKDNFERGCVAMQGATMAAIASLVGRPDSLWVAERVVVGSVMEHHAVSLHRKGQSMQSGIMLDPWIYQSTVRNESVFTFPEWKSHMRTLALLSAPRVE